METKWLKVDNIVDNLMNHPHIVQAAKLLTENEIVAFPTETVYGLGANAKSDEAVQKIYQAKGRPSDNPLIIHVANIKQVEEMVEEIPKSAQILMDRFWPGPLTILFPQKKGVLSPAVTANLPTVAIRMPNHPIALALIEAAQLPIAAPSANRSGKPSPTKASHVYDDLQGKIAAIIDGGETGVGVESTVIDCTENIPVILRPGGMTKEQIEAVIGEVHIDAALHSENEKPKSPGMKYTHYAPDAPLIVLDGSKEWIQKKIEEQQEKGLKVGILTTEENKDFYDADVVISCGNRKDLTTVAAKLYDTLREFNQYEIDLIYSEAFPNEQIGDAIMNRLRKAAGHRIEKEDQ